MAFRKARDTLEHEQPAETEVEGEIREFVRRDVATNLGRQPEHESERVASNITSVLQRVSGVTRVAITDTKQQIVGYEVDSETGRDVRRELAAAIVGRGWGLLEMRPMRLSLEEIFLHVTTEETPATAAAATEAEMASSQELVQ